MRPNQIEVVCSFCNLEFSVPMNRRKRSKNLFCSTDCANAFQGRNKIDFICKVCENTFKVSASEVEKLRKRGHVRKYCSINCRNSDRKEMTLKAQKMNEAQRKKSGLNKLELAGREWLQGMGFMLDLDFREQVLLFDKFCVDVVIDFYKLVVQFDGEYWHTKEKRKKLDESQDQYLKKAGYRIFRITDKEMYSKDEILHEKLTKRWLSALIGFNCEVSKRKNKAYG